MRFHRFFYGLAIFASIALFGSSAMAQGDRLVRAEWGVPGNMVDVTARVRTFVHDGVLQLEVTRFNLGIDPAPHQNKDLIIKVQHRDGQIEDYKYPERSNCSLELGRQDPWEGPRPHDRGEDHHDWDDHHDGDGEDHEHGVEILRAEYGAEGQFVNVTDTVRSYMNDGHISMMVDNRAMGIDPAPGVHKVLRVVYVQHGERRNIMVDEKTFLQLP